MGVQFLKGPCWKGLDRTLTQTFIRHSVRSSRSLGSTFLSLGPLWPEKEEPLLSGAQARPGCGKSRMPEAPVWPPRPSVKCRPHLGDLNLPAPCRLPRGNQGLLWGPTLATGRLSGPREVAAKPRSVSCSKSTPRGQVMTCALSPCLRLTTPLSMNPPPRLLLGPPHRVT